MHRGTDPERRRDAGIWARAAPTRAGLTHTIPTGGRQAVVVAGGRESVWHPTYTCKLISTPHAEDEMLDDTASERKPNSRLSCQIKSSAELDGIVIHMPEEQE